MVGGGLPRDLTAQIFVDEVSTGYRETPSFRQKIRKEQ